MTHLLIACAALAAAVALAAADTPDSPEITSVDSDLHMRLPRNADMIITRNITTTSTVSGIEDRLEAIETGYATTNALHAAELAMTTTAHTAAMGAFASTLQQTENVRTSLTASINGISSSVAGQQATLTAEVAATLNSHALAANAALRVMEQQLASALLAINASLVAGLAANRPKTGYMQVGRKTCSKPAGSSITTTRLHTGFLWGSYHSQGGGGNKNLCLEDSGGNHGGYHTGGDGRDAIRPLAIHSGNTVCQNCILRSIANSKVLPCAMCIADRSCFSYHGNQGCPSGFDAMYSGYFYGPYKEHRGNNERECIDIGGSGTDWNHPWGTQTWGGHLYPTLEYTPGGFGQRNGGLPRSVACSFCCAA
jgi:hypothetical protein